MADLQQALRVYDSSITKFQGRLALFSRSHPLRLACLLALVMLQSQRHALSSQMEDLDKSILYLAESLLLSHRLWLERSPSIFQSLSLLAIALSRRSQLSQQPQDAIFAAKYLRYLLNQPVHSLRVARHPITTTLVDTLDVQLKSEAGNVMENIEEMTTLCRELLTSDVSDAVTTRPIILFTSAIAKTTMECRGWVPDPLLTQFIECMRLARIRKPELRIIHTALATCLCCRYIKTFVNEDYEEAATILDETIASHPQDESFESVILLERFVTEIAVLRSGMHNTPEYTEEAMYRIRAFPVENPAHSHFRRSLENIAKRRFYFFGLIELEASSTDNSPPSQPAPAPTEEYEYLDPEFGTLQRKAELVTGLLSGIRGDDVVRIDEAIEKSRSILASSPPHLFALLLSDSVAGVLFGAFKHTKKIEHLNESISILREALDRPFAQNLRFTALGHLSLALLTRSQSFPDYCTRDIDEALELLSRCANDAHSSLHDRFEFAYRWASFARGLRHASAPVAYEYAMTSLTQDVLLFAPTLQLQHNTLSTGTTFDYSRRMPLNYASYQVDLDQLEEAIVTLERGRALLWSEMRHFRTSIDQVLRADPDLGHKFAAVNGDLEELTKSIPPSHKLSMDHYAADGLRAVDPFGRLLVKQRKLLKERDNLISQIRALPGFDSFLASPSFDTLRFAASSGPVVIINHSSWRSDILILLHDASPSLISTPTDFYTRANTLKDNLLDTRNKHEPDSSQYNQALSHVLTELYDLVGKPVIDRFRQLKIPEQSRVWWCPTSVFCSLPLHAMGPIPSDDGGEERYFLDLYIPSYTPTLSALIQEPDEPRSPASGLPSLLLVAHFDVPSPDVPLEDVKVVQELHLRLPVKSLVSEDATPASVLDGLRDHQFVHFVCHGTLQARKPFDAGFELHGQQRLTLLEIVRARLPAAEFAFLAACHTAELTYGSSADESLHLAAAAQYCGFRSVVGTMWAMADLDGPDLAKHFYRSVFSPRKEQAQAQVPYYKRSAGALREAVKKLRRKRGITLERWVNFVHYGA